MILMVDLSCKVNLCVIVVKNFYLLKFMFGKYYDLKITKFSEPIAMVLYISLDDSYRLMVAKLKKSQKGATLRVNKKHPKVLNWHGWGKRIRTFECQSQSLMPYRLAIPQSMCNLASSII